MNIFVRDILSPSPPFKIFLKHISTSKAGTSVVLYSK